MIAFPTSNLSIGTMIVLLVLAAMAGCGGETPESPSELVLHSNNKLVSDSIPQELAAGKQIYDSKCELCHNKGEEGAPKLGNVTQWEARVVQGEDVLTRRAIDGFDGERGEMPPQGKKFSDKEVRAAVRYMIYCYEQEKGPR